MTEFRSENLKIGDLVLCTWQPTIREVLHDGVEPLKHRIKGRMGIILDHELHRYAIAFPALAGYVHWLSKNAFEVINESR